MDANGTHFHLLLGPQDWGRCRFQDPRGEPVSDPGKAAVVWNRCGSELTLMTLPFEFKASPADRAPRLGDPHRSPPDDVCDRRGAARDRFGNWYFLGADSTEILVWSAGCRAMSHFWSADEAVPTGGPAGLFQPVDPVPPLTAVRFQGLAVTEDHYLVVGTLEPKGLLVFDLHGGGGPVRHIRWPASVPFEPFDLSARPGGGVWVLDRRNRSYWGLARNFAVVGDATMPTTLGVARRDTFQPRDGAVFRQQAARIFPGALSLDHSSPVAAEDPIAIEALPDDTVMILEAAAPPGILGAGLRASRLLRYKEGVLMGNPVPLTGGDPGIAKAPGPGFAFVAYDFAFLPTTDPADPDQLGRLYFVGEAGNQALAMYLRAGGDQLSLELIPDFMPLRLFGGRGVVADGGAVHYDSRDRWVPLVVQPRPRYVTSSEFVTDPDRPFDGRDPQCVWHRLLFDGSVPAEAEVAIWSRASDDPARLAALAWDLEPNEPKPYRRRDGSELPFVPSPVAPDRGTFELLFQKARGRYLQLRIRLTGNGRVTPRLRALRIHYPRFSYLDHYLPAVYRQDPDSASFLDRFLANLEGINTGIEDCIAAAQVLFDPRSAPAESLDWLASWFGLALDPAWDGHRRRLLLAHAMDFFAWRGTAHGLRMALRVALEPSPDEHLFDPPDSPCRCGDRFRIVERFVTRFSPPVSVGDPTDGTGPTSRAAGDLWTPDRGADDLQRRYRVARQDNRVSLTLLPADSADEAAAQAAFARQELGFVPASPADDVAAWQRYLRDHYAGFAEFLSVNPGPWTNFSQVPVPADRPATARLREDWRLYINESESELYGVQRRLWQQFLAGRHVGLGALNAAHGTAWESFDTIAYPAVLPANRALLQDWYDFEARVLVARETAHQMSVLLPLSPAAAGDLDQRRALLSRTRRIVTLERPAHATFDVRFYWDLFRVGEARLGFESVLGLGARDPSLRSAAVLGQAYLSESFISTRRPYDRAQRNVLGELPLN